MILTYNLANRTFNFDTDYSEAPLLKTLVTLCTEKYLQRTDRYYVCETEAVKKAFTGFLNDFPGAFDDAKQDFEEELKEFYEEDAKAWLNDILDSEEGDREIEKDYLRSRGI